MSDEDGLTVDPARPFNIDHPANAANLAKLAVLEHIPLDQTLHQAFERPLTTDLVERPAEQSSTSARVLTLPTRLHLAGSFH